MISQLDYARYKSSCRKLSHFHVLQNFLALSLSCQAHLDYFLLFRETRGWKNVNDLWVSKALNFKLRLCSKHFISPRTWSDGLISPGWFQCPRLSTPISTKFLSHTYTVTMYSVLGSALRTNSSTSAFQLQRSTLYECTVM